MAAKQLDKVQTQLDERAAFLLSQLGHHVAYRCGELLAPLGLHPAHYGILVHLSHKEGVTQQQLADSLGVHRNAMVGLIDELEDRKLVRRKRSARDRRAHQIQLTTQAHKALAEANAAADSLEDEVLACFDAAERDTLVALLHRAAERAQLRPGIHPGLRRRRIT